MHDLNKKKAILQKWKSESVPIFESWLRDLSNVLLFEELRYKWANGKQTHRKHFTHLVSRLQISLHKHTLRM